ncbi:hypothetical protein B0H13DRAFT_1925581 [Mycena leptocephala]|nr:hypothetical protein B0H13DRAFT_1925581 [Mycena leptocephala]
MGSQGGEGAEGAEKHMVFAWDPEVAKVVAKVQKIVWFAKFMPMYGAQEVSTRGSRQFHSPILTGSVVAASQALAKVATKVPKVQRIALCAKFMPMYGAQEVSTRGSRQFHSPILTGLVVAASQALAKVATKVPKVQRIVLCAKFMSMYGAQVVCDTGMGIPAVLRVRVPRVRMWYLDFSIPRILQPVPVKCKKNCGC